MSDDKIGRIVWHDLFTADRQRSMAFYKRVAGWTYQIEHATDFAWGGGEKDFVLALLDEEAGAGFAETPAELSNGWVAYVEVRDVDATVVRVEELGGTIVRKPFEVPGVGRNALVRDPLGALFGISLSRHSFPIPQRQFGPEVYLSGAAFPEAFYGPLFGWTAGAPQPGAEGAAAVAGPSGDIVAFHLIGKPPKGDGGTWLPNLKVASSETALRAAEDLGAKPFGDALPEPEMSLYVVLHDPDGALLCLQRE